VATCANLSKGRTCGGGDGCKAGGGFEDRGREPKKWAHMVGKRAVTKRKQKQKSVRHLASSLLLGTRKGGWGGGGVGGGGVLVKRYFTFSENKFLLKQYFRAPNLLKSMNWERIRGSINLVYEGGGGGGGGVAGWGGGVGRKGRLIRVSLSEKRREKGSPASCTTYFY